MKMSYTNASQEEMGNIRESTKRLEWRNLTYFSSSSSSSSGPLLDDCYGRLHPGEVSAIVGPSGAGKSTLMNILSGRMAWDYYYGKQNRARNGTLSGVIRYGEIELLNTNGTSQKSSRKVQQQLRELIGYVMQDDALLPRQTVRETLEFHAWLRMVDRTDGQSAKETVRAKVDEILRKLNLSEKQDLYVGDSNLKGISGGEKKRLAIGIELLKSPQILFLDEPTSGLDSYSALQLGKLLRELAIAEQIIICCCVHQPSSELFELFDVCTLLRKGKILIKGYVNSEGVRAYGGLRTTLCGKKDYTCPQDENDLSGDDDDPRELKVIHSHKHSNSKTCLPCLLKPEDESLLEDLSALPSFLKQIAKRPVPKGVNLAAHVLELASDQSLSGKEYEEIQMHTARLHELLWDVFKEEGASGLSRSSTTPEESDLCEKDATLKRLKDLQSSVEKIRKDLRKKELVPPTPENVIDLEGLEDRSTDDEEDDTQSLLSRLSVGPSNNTPALYTQKNTGKKNMVHSEPRSNFFRQVQQLTKRDLKERLRDPLTIVMRFLVPFIQISMICLAYVNTGRELTRFERFLGAQALERGERIQLQDSAGFTTKIREHWGKADDMPFMAYVQAGTLAVLTFQRDRLVFMREYFGNAYSLAAYFLSKFLVEVLFLLIQIPLLQVTIPYFLLGCSGSILAYYAVTFLAALAGGSLGTLLASAAPMHPERIIQLAPLILSTMTNIFIGNFRSPADIWPPLAFFGFLFSETRTGPIIAKAEIGSGAKGWFKEKCAKLFASDKLPWHSVETLNSSVGETMKALENSCSQLKELVNSGQYSLDAVPLSDKVVKRQCSCFAVSRFKFVEERYPGWNDSEDDVKMAWMVGQVLLIVVGFRLLACLLLWRNSQTMLK